MNLAHLWIELLNTMLAISFANVALIAIGALLVIAGVLTRRFMEVLLPLGFGIILANFGAFSSTSALGFFYAWGISTGIVPLLAIAGMGAMTDFRPLLTRPRLLVAAIPMLVGVFAALLLAGALKYPIQSAAAIALAGTLNPPAAIYAANSLNPDLVGPLGFASLLLPLILLWAALRLSGQPFADQEFDASQAPDSLPNVNPSSQVIFSLVITILIGVFFRVALPLAAAFLLGSLLRPGPVSRLLPSGFAAALTRAAVVLVSLLVGSSLVAGVMFTPTALKAWLIALGGLVLCAAIFWLILRPQIDRGVINLERLGGLPAVMGAVSAIELVSLILTCILVTVASLIQ